MNNKESEIIDYSFLEPNITFLPTSVLKYCEYKNAKK